MQDSYYEMRAKFSEGEKPETKQKRLEAKYGALQIVPNVDKLGTAKVKTISRINKFLLDYPLLIDVINECDLSLCSKR